MRSRQHSFSIHKCAGKSYYHQYSLYEGVLHLHREDRMLCGNAMKTISDVARIEISIVSLFGMLRKPQTCIEIGHQGWTPRPAGRGGSPPRPVKMIKTVVKLRGRIKAQITTFSNRGNHCMMQIYYNTEQCPIQPVNMLCKRK